MNIFQAKQIPVPALVVLIFVKKATRETILHDIGALFNTRVDNEQLCLINWVEKFHTPFKNIFLDTLYEQLNGESDLDHIFHLKKNSVGKKQEVVDYVSTFYNKKTETVSTNGPSCAQLEMDIQRFGALIIKPFPNDSNLTIEIYPSGIINATGINDENMFARLKEYIELKLFRSLAISSCPDIVP